MTAGRRGTLRIHLGAAPGVGKTFAMLNEGRRAKERGTDVVIAVVETHGRPRTAEQLQGLEVIPRRRLDYRGATFEEMDVDAVIARRPARALVDELAHTNIPGSRNEKRWQDVNDLLEAGIDVISTVNIQHLESLNDVVESITGIQQRETVPDEVVRAADQVELVDVTPEALRRRMAHGNVYAADKMDAALGNYFRTGNLSALRELALLWVADKVEVGLEDYRERYGITGQWETRERVVVAVTGAPGTEALIRRAARIAQRAHGDLLGVHVIGDEGLAGPASGVLDDHRKLLEGMGGTYHELVGSDPAAALAEFSRSANATQMVLGATSRSRWSELVRGSVVNRAIRLSGPIDVHVISNDPVPPSGSTDGRADGRADDRGSVGAVGRVAPQSARRVAFSTRRQVTGWMIAVVGVPLLTLVLAQLRHEVDLPAVLLLYLAVVVGAAAAGGTRPALVGAISSFLFANWFFTPPYYRWTVGEPQHLVALIVFMGLAVVVSQFVDVAARRSAEAARARSEAKTLARLSVMTTESDPLGALLENLVAAFGLEAAAVLRRTDHGWSVDAGSGSPLPARPEDGTLTRDLSSDTALVLTGGKRLSADRAVLDAFAAQLGAIIERSELRREADRGRELAETNALRAALLQAVSHDLRTPLASIKASVDSLRQPDIDWPADDRDEFLETIGDETDRLTRLVEQLLDMSRIQAGVIEPDVGPVAVEDVVPAAVDSLGRRGDVVELRLSADTPDLAADPVLLERALANVIANAARFSPPGRRVRVESGSFGDMVDIRVVDEGPGIPVAQRVAVFQPFQRLDDHSSTGVGLGLAIARGFVSSMGGTVEIEDTPGGGATVVISLPVAA